ncbi:SARP family transcriptional regulator [Saccharopolyspora sp. K220]|uniref:AfsR/SARP family transcriptional regulator n=1 Tax=Saccharopolyspora soli TaxID=2926618 RepID=UPI001F55FE01|nr:BTAD domain-containing putative transcriptional regulator [Saccharopolyspora soli]MCI2415800.1 SARP family transcriptional regulator [Saccharopolyspora soli]
MRIRLMGPVELISADGRIVDLGAVKRRIVLATLALNLNQVVSGDRLMDVAWGGKPPPSAKSALQGHIAQLRKGLGRGVELATRAPGYQLLADRGLVDMTRFDDLIADARGAPDVEAVELLRTALELRRGPVLADLPADGLRAQVAARMEESEIAAVQQLGERLHRLGRITEAISLLRDVVDRHPLREPLVELLVFALHRGRRQAEALSLYHRTRELLAEELGVDPSAGLQQAYQLVLAGTEDQEVPVPQSAPAQLPREHRGFVGRDAELALLSTKQHGADAIRVLVGPAGVGKTALALRWAHQVAPEFPDGNLFVNLRGFDETEPVEPGTALTGFLRALGVPDVRVPVDVDERAALYRSMLANRRMLVVLDNARNAAQVRPLLPGMSSSAVLVASRDRLDELVVTEGAVRVLVGRLSRADAVTTLRQVAGDSRVEAEPAAAAELVELCDRLPLALRIAAGRLATHPQWTIRAVLGELSDERRRLDVFSPVSAGGGIRAALGMSYRHLPAEAARLFRLLGHHPGNDLDSHAAAALAGTTVRAVRQHLEWLTSMHLLHETGPGRYGRHDLIRLYTAALAVDEPAEERENTCARLLDYYLSAGEASRWQVADIGWRPETPEHVPAELPELGETKNAVDWFTTEEGNLHRTLELAVAQNQFERTWRLARCLESFYYFSGDIANQFNVSRIGLAAARELGNSEAQASFHASIASVLTRLGLAEKAIRHCENALRAARRGTSNECITLIILGQARFAVGRLPEARAALAAASELGDALGNTRLHVYALNVMAHVLRAMGKPADALDATVRALELAEQRPDSLGYTATLLAAGKMMHWVGLPNEALALLDRGLHIAEEMSDLYHQAGLRTAVGFVLLSQRDETAAAPHFARAAQLYTALGHPYPADLRDEIDAQTPTTADTAAR